MAKKKTPPKKKPTKKPVSARGRIAKRQDDHPDLPELPLPPSPWQSLGDAIRYAESIPVRYRIPDKVVACLQEIPPKKLSAPQHAFLISYACHGIVSKAASDAGVSVESPSKWRKISPLFKRLCRLAKKESNDRLILEARRRAEYGVARVRLYKGQPILDDKGNPVVETIYSDGLMQTMLKARCPEFKDQFNVRGKVEHGGTVKHEATGKFSIDDLGLPLEVREAILDKMREIRERARQPQLPGPVIDVATDLEPDDEDE